MSFSFIPVERADSLMRAEGTLSPASLKKHHGLCGFVVSFQKQWVLITEDARSTVSIMGDILLSKINDL